MTSNKQKIDKRLTVPSEELLNKHYAILGIYPEDSQARSCTNVELIRFKQLQQMCQVAICQARGIQFLFQFIDAIKDTASNGSITNESVRNMTIKQLCQRAQDGIEIYDGNDVANKPKVE